MRIAIAERLHPYCHTPGALCLLPGSTLCLQIFPALIRLYDLSACRPLPVGEVALGLEGPVSKFTVVQDLEQCAVRVFGQARGGYFRYACRALPATQKIHLQIEKGSVPLQGVPDILAPDAPTPIPKASECLSVGNHKAQDWELIQRRQKLEEILPLWFALGQLTPHTLEAPSVGTALMMEACQRAIGERDREALVPAFLHLFLAGFSGMLVPRLEDDQHQGFGLSALGDACRLSPLVLLTRGAQIIRSLFIQQEGNRVAILPALPPEFHAGRMTGVLCPPYGRLDLEWSKKQIRRMLFTADADGELQFTFQPDLQSFRLRPARLSCGDSFAIEKGKQYLLDNFQR